MSLPTPYYDKDGITIYCSDCREVLPFLEPVDLVLTDPPYGIGAHSGVGKYGVRKWGACKAGDWDSAPPSQQVFTHMEQLSSEQVIWGGNYFQLRHSRCWLIWDKGAGFRGRNFCECEMAWCSRDGVTRVLTRDPLAERDYEGKQHPTMKPLKLMTWCLSFFPDAQTILDPFMGSGTTLVAAKLLGKKAIGIEISEEYCKIAVNRLAQGVMNFAD